MKIKYSFSGSMNVSVKANVQEFRSEHYNRAQEEFSFEYSMENVSMEIEENLEPQEIPTIVEGLSRGLVSILSQHGQNKKETLNLNTEIERLQDENRVLRKENFNLKWGYPKKDDPTDPTDPTDYREVNLNAEVDKK